MKIAGKMLRSRPSVAALGTLKRLPRLADINGALLSGNRLIKPLSKFAFFQQKDFVYYNNHNVQLSNAHLIVQIQLVYVVPVAHLVICDKIKFFVQLSIQDCFTTLCFCCFNVPQPFSEEWIWYICYCFYFVYLGQIGCQHSLNVQQFLKIKESMYVMNGFK